MTQSKVRSSNGSRSPAEKSLVNLDARFLDPFLCDPVHADVRIDSRDLGGLLRIMGQVQSGAEADFQNLAKGMGQQELAVLGDEGPT